MKNFKKYDEENPLIWKYFKKISSEAKAKGFKNYSSKGIFEIIRWHTGISGNDKFKINNNYHPDYARKMMKQYKSYKGFFRTREIKSKRANALSYTKGVKKG